MRIVYLSPVGVMGGAERCLLQVMEAIHRHEPGSRIVLIAGSKGELLERAQASGIETRLLPMPKEMSRFGESVLHRRHNPLSLMRLAERAAILLPKVRKYCDALSRAVRSYSPELIHSNGLKMHLLAALSGIPAHRTVWHLHDFLADRPTMGRALRWASRRAAGAIAISQAIAHDAHHVLPRLRVRVVYNSIDVAHFCPAAAEGPGLDALAGLTPAPAGTVRVGLVATFARWKGQDLLMRAAAQLFARTPDAPVRFFVIGGPIYHTDGSQFKLSDLRQTAQQLGIQNRIGFIGFQNDPRDIFRALDVVVHASTSPEPFGLTIAEAMSCGRPVIVSRAGGAAELFTHGLDAVGFEPGSAQELADAIDLLARNPARRAELGSQARASAQARFSHAGLATRMISAYSDFLTSAQPDAYLPIAPANPLAVSRQPQESPYSRTRLA